jgi:hypothetical protein
MLEASTNRCRQPEKGRSMAAVTHDKCIECGKRHAFCLPDANEFIHKAVYAYKCPSTGRVARLVAPNHWTVAPSRCPKDSVVVKLVDAQLR